MTANSDWNFTISNTGNSNLTINGIDSDNPAFTITPLTFPQDIAPGKSLNVTATFSPTEEKSYTGIITITSNVPDKSKVSISLEGIGVPDNCDVNSDGVVNILDLVIVGKYFGKSAPDNAKADVNKDGIVDILDLNIVGQYFGEVYK
ncbi:choice-of-anchor D domain-containing protein [Candidatus Poribacteria bacterium]|nr:choice-of-anchor D domain-containing protein [Candidatus Poribacteria bacterium]